MNNSGPKINLDELVNALKGAVVSSNKKITQLTTVFDIVRKVNEKEKFKTASLALTGEIADSIHAERVCLGWLKHDYIRIKSISHTDHFEKKMQIVQDLEAAMEEAYEQDAAIAFPAKDDTLSVRAHEFYSKKHNAENLLSIPVRQNDEVIAILTCERPGKPFNDDEATQIHLVASLVASRLKELYQHSSWFGARMARSMRNGLAKLFGFDHTWLKFFGVVGIAIILFATLVPIQYKISSPAILKTDKIIYLTSPFDGYIDSVCVKPGDIVYKGQELLRLDQKELRLEEANLTAEEQNYRREIQKAEASQELAEMRIQQAKLEQTLAKLETVRFKLSKSVITSTADSAIIIEGDLQKRIGAPVNQGTELFQMASIENIYVEVNVSELEIERVNINAKGILAVKSHPENDYSFVSERISPTATVKEQENTFPVRGEFTDEVPSWFRPGMTGVAKIYAGKKTLWWILSHQAIDYLRLKLWW